MDNIKEKLNTKDIVTSFIILILEIGLLVIAAKSVANDKLNGGWGLTNTLIFFLLFGSLLSIYGVFKSIKLMRLKKVHIVSSLLSLISILTFPIPGIFIMGGISYYLEEKELAPIRQQDFAQKITTQNESAAAFKMLTEDFKLPQQIIAAEIYKNLYPILILKNGDIIKVQGLSFEKQEKYKNLITWVNTNLLNKDVQIILPSVNFDFIKTCNSYTNGDATINELRQKYNLSGDTCSFITVQEIYYNNKEALYKRFLQ